MVKSSDLTRGYQAVEADRIRRVVRQHEAQQRWLRKSEALPGAGVLGFLAGWSVMKALNNILKDHQ